MTHDDALVVLIGGVLAFSRCGDSLSVDQLVRRWSDRWLGNQPDSRARSGEYCWPVRLSQTLLVLTYFLAGVAKLRHGGLEWVFSDNMRNILLLQHYTSAPPKLQFGLWASNFPWVYRSVAGVAVLIELAAPLALFDRRLKWILIPALLALTVGFWLLLGPLFWGFFPCYVFWINWSWLGSWLTSAGGHKPSRLSLSSRSTG